jgi:hypothetical protein
MTEKPKTGLFDWFTKLQRRKHEPTFTATLGEIDSFKKLIKASHCPGCNQLTLHLSMFGRGPQGWEAEVFCSNCRVGGVVNSTGFKFERLEKDGKKTKE